MHVGDGLRVRSFFRHAGCTGLTDSVGHLLLRLRLAGSKNLTAPGTLANHTDTLPSSRCLGNKTTDQCIVRLLLTEYSEHGRHSDRHHYFPPLRPW